MESNGTQSVKTYPRASDPANNKPLRTTVSGNAITVNVGPTLDNPLELELLILVVELMFLHMVILVLLLVKWQLLLRVQQL